MAKLTSLVLGIVLFTITASGCISVHKKESKEEVPARTVEHTVVVP